MKPYPFLAGLCALAIVGFGLADNVHGVLTWLFLGALSLYCWHLDWRTKREE